MQLFRSRLSVRQSFRATACWLRGWLAGLILPWTAQFSKAVLRANFAEDREISDPEVVIARLNGLGLDSPRLLEQAQTAESTAKLRTQTEYAKSLGILGAPSFLVGKEMFLGKTTAWKERWRGRGPVMNRVLR